MKYSKKDVLHIDANFIDIPEKCVFNYKKRTILRRASRSEQQI